MNHVKGGGCLFGYLSGSLRRLFNSPNRVTQWLLTNSNNTFYRQITFFVKKRIAISYQQLSVNEK